MKFNKTLYILFSVLVLLATAAPFYAGAACGAFDFNFAPNYSVGQNVVAYTSADFNADGKIDVAVVNADRAFSVIFGDGAGGFAPPVVYSTDYDIWRGMTAADINADGKPDLVIGSNHANQLNIYFNNGSGAFNAPPITYTSPVGSPNQGEWYDLKSGDFNGDDKADIVAVQYQSGKKLKFFLNNGAGGIALTGTLNINFNVNDTEGIIGLGNIDGDAATDVFVSAGDDNRSINWVMGRTDGNFSLTGGFGVEERPTAIRVADLNNDSVNDIAASFEDTTTPTQSYMRVWLNIAGTFTAQPRIDVPAPVDLAVGDYNGDGKQDLAAVLNAGVVITEYGLGNGAFQNERLWTVPQGNFILAADANLDGKADLISLGRSFNNYYLSVLTNTNFTGFTAPKPIYYGEKLITAGDLNNDSLLDIITSPTDFGGGSSYIAYALNDNARSFLPALTVDNGPDNIKALETGDFNGDGKLDVVSAHGNNNRMIEVYLGNGTGTLAAGIPSSLNIISNDAVVSDFNADGKDDLFVVDDGDKAYTLLNNGNATFSIAPNFPMTLQTDGFRQTLQKGDFNNDGKIDIVTISDNRVVALYLGTGGGQFTLLSANVGRLGHAVPADLNGDGKLDLAGFPVGIPAGVAGILGDGTGGFGAPFAIPFGNGVEFRSLVAADFNDDGLDDVAFALGINEDGPGLVVVPSNADGASPSWETPLVYSFGVTPSNIIAADFDHDGKKDVGFTNGISRGVFYNTAGAKPCLSISDATVTEGNTGTTAAAFTVNLSAPSTETVRVNYTLEMVTATSGADVENVSGRFEIPAGQTTATIDVPVAGDLLDEFDETFKLNLFSPSGASLVNTSALGTIVDNDAEPTLTISDVSRSESDLGQFALTVSLSAPSGKTILFRYATADGTAVADRDYAAITNALQNFQPGNTSMVIGFPVFDEGVYELDENFFVNITEPVNVTLADPQGQVTILNNDSVPTVNVSGVNITEGDTGSNTATHSFFLSNPSYLPVTINYASADGTATAGTDYVAVSGSVVVQPEQQQSGSFSVQSVGDTINEPTESFNLNLSVTNAGPPPVPATVQILDDERIANDYDNDGKTDLVVFRPSDRTWYTQFSSTGAFSGIQYGLTTDIPVSGDYNGDGRTDITVWRPSDGVWYSRVAGRTQQFGAAGDVPVHGDYDNDGRIDLAVFRPSDTTWYIQLTSNGSYMFVQFGLGDDKPVPADYDGDGKTDIAVYRPSDSTWYIRPSTNNGFYALRFGLPDDKLVPADYDGDGKADIAVFRDGDWFITRSSDNGFTAFHWGQAGDKPVPGNYDGDAKADYAVYRDGIWWVFRSSTNTYTSTQFGLPDDVPIPFVSNQ
jgi:ribose 5-phosphate isomerase